MRYEIQITQHNRPTVGRVVLLVHDGDDWDSALRDYRDAVSRSQGEWTNHVFLGQDVTLLYNQTVIREYVGQIQCRRDEATGSDVSR